MTPERWTQIEELFHQACECHSKDRDALLDEACRTDPELRREVVALLASEENARDHLHAAVREQLETVGFPLIGETISHYRIIDGLSGGGMGLVYRAEDIKLGRRVALKFLPEDSARDSAARGRFEREARAASALEHPNICPIYEFGEHEGRPFLVMQLLEGQTLRELISAASSGKPPLSLSKLLDFAMQITAGLEAAHSLGIIHRDIKPANLFVTTEGQAKILDFGLAKLASLARAGDSDVLYHGDGDEDVQRAAEKIVPMAIPDSFLSLTGVAMGTAGYMSPEQVRGEKLDARTDLFSFGLVLYEMATGQRAFKGDTGPVIQKAILNENPAPVRELNPELPAKLEQIITKALEKGRETRYQSAAELRADLEVEANALRRRTDFGSVKSWRFVVGAAIASLVIAGFVFWRRPSRSPTLFDLKQRQLTANSSENAVSGGSISPDGRYLAYADLKGIHIKLIETGETQTVPQPDSLKGMQVNWGIATNWVRDGTRFIANANVSGKPSSIWVVSMLGGPPRKLIDKAYAWAVSRDGSSVAFTAKPGKVGDQEMWTMNPDGDQVTRLYQGDENNSFSGADWSPDGQRLSYGGYHSAANKSDGNIESRDLKGSPAVVAVPGDVEDWTWSPDGRIIYIESEPSPQADSCNFWTVPIDARTGRPSGLPRRLTNWAGFCMEDPTVTANGKRLAFRKISEQGEVYVADLQAKGMPIIISRHLTTTEDKNYPAAWTTDSKSVVFRSYRGGQWTIFKQSIDEDVAEPVVTGTEDLGGASATVSPTGAWVLYLAKDAPTSDPALRRLMRVPLTGGSSELVLTAPIYGGPACARSYSSLCVIAEQTPDRKQLIFTAFDPEKGRGGELTRFDTDPGGGGVDYVWDLSPDGASIAILRFSKGPIYILPLDGRDSQEIAVKGWSGLISLNWAPDGKSIYTFSQTKQGSVLLRVDPKGSASVLWEQNGSIAPWNRQFSGVRHSAPFAVPSPDGHHLAIYSWSFSANMWMMENF